MSFEDKIILSNDVIDKSYELNKYYKIIYISNEKEEELIDRLKKILEENHLILDKEKAFKEDSFRLFGEYFFKQNSNKCKIIYNNKKYKLKEYFDEINNNYNHNIKEIKLKLIGINNISNMKGMFMGCNHLLSVSESNDENSRKLYDIFSDSNQYQNQIMKILENYMIFFLIVIFYLPY